MFKSLSFFYQPSLTTGLAKLSAELSAPWDHSGGPGNTYNIELFSKAVIDSNVCIPKPVLGALSSSKFEVLQDNVLTFRAVPRKSDEAGSGK